MKIADYLLIFILICAAVVALIYTFRHKGGCADCTECSHCANCGKNKTHK